MVAGQITSAAVMLLASALTLGTTSVNAGELDVPGAGTFIPRAAPLIKDYKRAASKTYSVAQDYSGQSHLVLSITTSSILTMHYAP